MAFNANTIDTAPILTIGQATAESHDLTGDDVDIFGVELEAGRIYRVGTDPLDAQGDFADSFDPYMRIFNEAGVEVFAADDGAGATALGSGANFAPNYSGTYYFAYSMNGNTQYDPRDGSNTIVGVPGDGDADVFFVDLRSTTYSSENNASLAPTWQQLQDDDRQVRVVYEREAPAFGVDVAKHFLEKGEVVVADINSVGFPDTAVRVVDPDDSTVLSQEFGNSSNGDDGEVVFTAREDGAHAIGPITSGTGGAGANYELILHLNPTIIGDSGVDAVDATPGDDYAVGLSGADSFFMRNGDDVVGGGDGDDFIEGFGGRDQLFGENGNDTLLGQGDNDVVVGGLGDDDLDGGGGNDVLDGGRGSDTLFGDIGNDTLSGGDGGDLVEGGNGEDELSGGAGNDRLFGQGSGDNIDGGAGDDILNGGIGPDALFGRDGDDQLLGGEGTDTLGGGAGNDELVGGIGRDFLDGGDGNDFLSGGVGIDVLAGGLGADTLTGGVFRDTFVFEAGVLTDSTIDQIVDFQPNVDLIDLDAVLDATANAGNIGDFVFALAAVGGSRLFVDPNGSVGGSQLTEIAFVEDVAPGVLVDSDNFIV